MIDLFRQSGAEEMIARINKLHMNIKPQWGKMDVAQMLAHCNVAYELVFDNKHAKPGSLKRFLLKAFVKESVVSSKPYKKNAQTAPEFMVKSNRDFEVEKTRLIGFINKVQSLGRAYFEGKMSHSFGQLSEIEWNNMFAKHLDHHLIQFGV